MNTRLCPHPGQGGVAVQLWLGLACFVPLAVIALDPPALLRLVWRALCRRAGRDVALPSAIDWRVPAHAWLPALLMAIVGTGLIGLVMIR